MNKSCKKYPFNIERLDKINKEIEIATPFSENFRNLDLEKDTEFKKTKNKSLVEYAAVIPAVITPKM